MQPLYPIKSKESPREILAADFKSLCGGLPIHGGWGYTKADACIIEKDDPFVDPSIPFDGISVEYAFVEKRIYEEMIIFRPDGEKFSGIRWNLQEQNLFHEEGHSFDRLVFEITAFRDSDWEELKAEFEGTQGYGSPDFDEQAHEKRRQEKMVCFTREFWFDITSFYGQGLVNTGKSTGDKQINKYDLIKEFFSNAEDAVKFFVQLKELRFANEDGSCIAVLKKATDSKWTYELIWKDDKFVGEHIKPFKPSRENIDKFNNGCKGMAKLLETYIDTNDLSVVTNAVSPFGDMAYEEQ